MIIFAMHLCTAFANTFLSCSGRYIDEARNSSKTSFSSTVTDNRVAIGPWQADRVSLEDFYLIIGMSPDIYITINRLSGYAYVNENNILRFHGTCKKVDKLF